MLIENDDIIFRLHCVTDKGTTSANIFCHYVSSQPLSETFELCIYTHTGIHTYYITHIETNLLTQEYLGHSLQLASSNVPLQLGPRTGSFGRIWHTQGH